MENPNEYDDEEYLEASDAFQRNAVEIFNNLWNAGCDLGDIQWEITSALENTEFLSNQHVKVEIHIM